DQQGRLKANLTNDGLHLNGEAYLLWKHLVYPYVYDLQAKPSLIPMPQSVTWNEGLFPLYDCKTIVVKSAGLDKKAGLLKDFLDEKGIESKIEKAPIKNEPFIELQLDNNFTSPGLTNEAYKLIAE